jgi:hypothetical protein
MNASSCVWLSIVQSAFCIHSGMEYTNVTQLTWLSMLPKLCLSWLLFTTCTVVTKFTIDFLGTVVTRIHMVSVVTTATMATMVAVGTRTRYLFHCHPLLHLQYRVICLWATSWQRDVIRPVVRMSRSPACRLTQAFFAYRQRGDIHCVHVCRLLTKFGTLDTGLCRQIRLTRGRVSTPAYVVWNGTVTSSARAGNNLCSCIETVWVRNTSMMYTANQRKKTAQG